MTKCKDCSVTAYSEVAATALRHPTLGWDTCDHQTWVLGGLEVSTGQVWHHSEQLWSLSWLGWPACVWTSAQLFVALQTDLPMYRKSHLFQPGRCVPGRSYLTALCGSCSVTGQAVFGSSNEKIHSSTNNNKNSENNYIFQIKNSVNVNVNGTQAC